LQFDVHLVQAQKPEQWSRFYFVSAERMSEDIDLLQVRYQEVNDKWREKERLRDTFWGKGEAWKRQGLPGSKD